MARDADGRIDLGEISREQAAAMRRQPGAIRLAPGSHDQATGKGSGIAHIEARHGKEIRRAGYNSAEHLVADVVENHNEIRKGGAGSLLLVKRNGADKVAVVRLTKDASGEFYNVETAYLSRPSERRALLWSAAQSRSATPGGQPAFAREPVVPSDQTTPNALPSSNASSVAPAGAAVNEQRQPEATAPETKPVTSEPALIADQQTEQAVTGDKTTDKTADVKAELGAALGRQRAERLIERGTVNVIATQAEAEAMVASAEQGNAPTVKRSENGRIQGLYLNGQVHLVADGIEAGKAHGVLLHELGEHARQLGFAKDAEYREILASLEQRKDARGATGKAIRAAMARVPENTPAADYWSEVAAYLVEEHADVQTSLIQRLINFVKKWLFKAGAVSADQFTPADLAMFARAAVRAEGKEAPGGNKASRTEVGTDTASREEKIRQIKEAAERIVDGASEAVVPGLRPDLVRYGGSPDVHLVWGNKNYGLLHIGTKRDGRTVAKVLESVAVGRDVEFVPTKKTVRIRHQGFTAVLSLDEHGNKKTWLLTGWEEGRPDARGEVGAQSPATQTAPIFSRDDLGASLKKILTPADENTRPSGSPRYSRATPTPEQTRHETEAAEDHGAVAETFAKRRDINPTSRLIASAEYTLSKDPAGQRMVDAAGRQLEHRVQLENAILDGIEPGADAATYQKLHNSFVNTFKALRKASQASHNRVRDYLLAIDKSGRGFRLRREEGFLVTTPDGAELGVVKTKEQAYALRRDHHADTYGKKGRGGERVLIADYPIRKNGECPHFYTFLHNICNFLTGRCWVLTPFLEVGARAFGITFA